MRNNYFKPISTKIKTFLKLLRESPCHIHTAFIVTWYHYISAPVHQLMKLNVATRVCAHAYYYNTAPATANQETLSAPPIQRASLFHTLHFVLHFCTLRNSVDYGLHKRKHPYIKFAGDQKRKRKRIRCFLFIKLFSVRFVKHWWYEIFMKAF